LPSGERGESGTNGRDKRNELSHLMPDPVNKEHPSIGNPVYSEVAATIDLRA
jgi:hypothetical protein